MGRSAMMLAVVVLGTVITAQEPTPGTSASFEVASIKPSAPGSQGVTISGFNPSQFNARSAPLGALLVFAYGLRDVEQVIGGPAWVRSDAFDIAARAGGTPAISHVPAMVRTLLAERFTLKARIETRDGPIYALRVVRRDGAFGPNLRQAMVDCAALLASEPIRPAPMPDGRSPCTGRQSLSGRRRMLRMTALPMEQLAAMLGVAAGRDVVDRTSLTGTFDVELEWTHDTLAEPRAADPLTAIGGVSLFTAVREQLGLTLEPERGPVKVLVIDSVERPTPD